MLSLAHSVVGRAGIRIQEFKSCVLVLSLFGIFLPHGYRVNNSGQDFI